MKKKVITLSCIAAVAIASFVGTKAFQSNAYENGLLTQNVEALSKSEGGTTHVFDCFKIHIHMHGAQIRDCSSCKYISNTTGRGVSQCFL